MEEPAFNPYQSPLSELPNKSDGVDDALRPRYRLFSLGSVMLATALGSPWAGGIVMAVNYQRLGRVGAAIHAFVWTLLFSTALIMLAVLLPDEIYIPTASYILVQIGGMYYVAKSYQGAILEEHRQRDGMLASAWGAAGIGFLVAVAIAILVFGAAFAIEILLPD